VTEITGLVVRAATAADMPDAHAVVVAAGLSTGRDRSALEFYRTSPGGQLIVACQDGRVSGVSYAISFGQTGWIGNVAVAPDARGRGLGTAVSRAALDALHQAGVTTVLLTATDQGRPIYQRLGFVDDGGPYGIWWPESRPAPGPGDDVRPGSAEEVIGLDAAATGEDRGAFLSGLSGPIVVPVAGTGYRLSLPWGGGPVIASAAGPARALLTDLMRTDPDRFLAFPAENTLAAEVATSLGFRLDHHIPRMRLGPPVPGFRPERIFNVFSFGVG
jgi:GNAT superfamily N-acetyltransferase